MEKKEITLKIVADGSQAEQTGKSIKAQLREATNEAIKLGQQFGENSKEYTEAAKRVADLRDTVGDFNNKVAALNPDKFSKIATATMGISRGFEAAQGAAAIFGAESENVQKTLVKLQSAMALADGIQGVLDADQAFGGLANKIKGNVVKAFSTLKGAIIATGLGALVVVLGLVIANFDEVKKFIMKLFPGLDKLTDFVGGLINKFTDLIGVTSKSGRAMEKSIKSQEKAIESLDGYLDRNLDKYNKITQKKLQADLEYKKKLLAAEKQFEKDKDKATFERTKKELYDQQQRILRAADEERKTENKALTDKQNEQNKINQQERAANKQKEIDAAKERADVYLKFDSELKDKLKKKQLEQFGERKKTEQEILEEQKKAFDEIKNLYDNQQLALKQSYAKGKISTEVYNEKVLDLEKERIIKTIRAAENGSQELKQAQLELAEFEIKNNQNKNAKIEADDKEKEAKTLKRISDGYKATTDALDSIQAITDLSFAIKKKNLVEGSKEEEDYLKKQFDVNKAFQISTALINGIQGVLNITATSKDATGITTALRIAGQVALTAASVAKIAATQFKSTSTNVGGLTNVGAATGISQPNLPNRPTTPNTPVQPPIKVYVVEKDIKTAGATSDRLLNKAVVK
jgi:hypothetical protein